MTSIVVRQGDDDDIPFLAGIERAAGHLFLDMDMPEIAVDDPIPEEELRDAMQSGLLLVASPGADHDEPVAYLLARQLRESLHIEQVTVHPAYARQGIGARLIEATGAYATGQGISALTLTTFRDVPWNAPYYRRLGFTEVTSETLPPDLQAIVQRERDAGLDRWPRVVMRRACR